MRFQYHQNLYERSGDAEGRAEHAVGRACLSVEVGIIGKSVILIILRRDGEGNKVLKQQKSHCQEKPLARIKVPVPQTDTGR